MPMLKTYDTKCFSHTRFPPEVRAEIETAIADGKKVELEESQFSDPEEYDWSQVRVDGVPVPFTWNKGY